MAATSPAATARRASRRPWPGGPARPDGRRVTSAARSAAVKSTRSSTRVHESADLGAPREVRPAARHGTQSGLAAGSRRPDARPDGHSGSEGPADPSAAAGDRRVSSGSSVIPGRSGSLPTTSLVIAGGDPAVRRPPPGPVEAAVEAGRRQLTGCRGRPVPTGGRARPGQRSTLIDPERGRRAPPAGRWTVGSLGA